MGTRRKHEVPSSTKVTERRQGRALGPRARATRTAILNSALEQFATHGTHVGTAPIAHQADVTERIVFHYFGKKADLVSEAFTLATVTLTNLEPAPTIPLLASPVEVMASLLTQRIGHLRRHPLQFKLVTQELLLRPALWGQFVEHARGEFLADIDQWLDARERAGELRIPRSGAVDAIVLVIVGYMLTRSIATLWEEHEPGDIFALANALTHGLLSSGEYK